MWRGEHQVLENWSYDAPELEHVLELVFGSTEAVWG